MTELVRSSTSCALNYGEAQSAESRRDFTHKNRIVLKELRESIINQKIILESGLVSNTELLEKGISENEELVAIFARPSSPLKKTWAMVNHQWAMGYG